MNDGKTKATIEHESIFTEAFLVKKYLGEKWGDRTEVDNSEFKNMFNFDAYNFWADDLPQEHHDELKKSILDVKNLEVFDTDL